MTSLLSRVFGRRPAAEAVGHDDTPFRRAMDISDDLLDRMRKSYESNDPVRQVMGDVLAQHHNIPFMTTVYQAVQEAKSPLEQKSEDK